MAHARVFLDLHILTQFIWFFAFFSVGAATACTNLRIFVCARFHSPRARCFWGVGMHVWASIYIMWFPKKWCTHVCQCVSFFLLQWFCEVCLIICFCFGRRGRVMSSLYFVIFSFYGVVECIRQLFCIVRGGCGVLWVVVCRSFCRVLWCCGVSSSVECR